MKTYSMKEVSNETGLSSDTLRYYEKDGIISDITRLPNSHRQYTQHDLEWLKFIICLRSAGMSLKKIKEYRELLNDGDKTASKRKELLKNEKVRILQEMENLKIALSTIDYKIEYYRSIEESL